MRRGFEVAERRHFDRPDAFSAPGVNHMMIIENMDAGLACLLYPGALSAVPDINHGLYGNAHSMQIEGRTVGVVVIGEDHHAFARRNGIAIHIVSNRRCQHNPGRSLLGKPTVAL